MSEQTSPTERDRNDEQSGSADGEQTRLPELNDDGVGGTLGDKDGFEPEESEGVE